jgi:hypothetical protein
VALKKVRCKYKVANIRDFITGTLSQRIQTKEQIRKYNMYIHKCIHYNYHVLHSGAHIKQEHSLTESEKDSSKKHTQHANKTDNQLYYFM